MITFWVITAILAFWGLFGLAAYWVKQALDTRRTRTSVRVRNDEALRSALTRGSSNVTPVAFYDIRVRSPHELRRDALHDGWPTTWIGEVFTDGNQLYVLGWFKSKSSRNWSKKTPVRLLVFGERTTSFYICMDRGFTPQPVTVVTDEFIPVKVITTRHAPN